MKELILQYNTYFDNGYEHAYQARNGVFVKELPLMPADNLGDYFYIRDEAVNISTTAQAMVSNCATPFALTQTAVLVAVMKEGDETQLLNNLVSSLSWQRVIFRSAVIRAEAVIQQELGLMGAEVVQSTLANLSPNTIMVSIRFDYPLQSYLYTQGANCLPNPCPTCG